jgi:hypothetical protein
LSLKVLFCCSGVDLHFVSLGAVSKCNDIALFELDGLKGVQFDVFCIADEESSVGGGQINQHYCSSWCEVDAGVRFADGRMVQLEIARAVAAEEELALLLEEKLVDGLFLLRDDDGDSGSHFLVDLYALITDPIV